ncbi:hypothetical protein LOC68_05095 [Blastopirellula sp. JC732]|uniref:Uncharacterized protein n=1 Tax=Blastopirellula sediminis TaxID=2894196 RepID=A0A9X1SFH9_9BACT|nr:hypothetical protein [Blastopirellula sediminis]MCC9609461.1 hypothetical protein [Blastopirellula sediminis]MCC9627762.1 hypothetical protein [Blastopirellula sediminis]
MNRIFGLGIAIFFAIVGISLVGGEREATAALGCNGCSEAPACCGVKDCCGLFGLKCRPKCHCGGLFSHHKKCCGLFGLKCKCSCSAPSCCEPEPTCCEPEPTCCAPEPSCAAPEAAPAEASPSDEAPAPPAEASIRMPVRVHTVSFRR